MDRRSFIRAGVLGGAATALVSNVAHADAGVAAKAAGAFYYTSANPGRWEKKVGGHLPLIQVEKMSGGIKVQVTTPHEMNGYIHYIVKHTLLGKDMQVLGETMFDPAKDKTPISLYTLKDYTGPIYALSMCNKHDVWMNEAQV